MFGQAWRDYLHERADHLLTPVAEWLSNRHIMPNHVTLAGPVISAFAAVLIVGGWLPAAALVWLAGSALDLLDGALARTQGKTSPHGAFLDSTCDRISEGFIMASLVYVFARDGAAELAALTTLALVGSVLVSYIRARAEALGIFCAVGLFTRPERIVVLGAGMLFGFLEIAIVLHTVLTAITVVQRLHHVAVSQPPAS